MKGHIYTILELNNYLKGKFEADPTLATIYVRGEISNYKLHSSGHHYMTLKDDGSVIRAVMFRGDASKLKFRPESGMTVLAKGRVTVFPRDGQYQLYITDMAPDGVGALYAAFEQLKKQLLEEGLFDPTKKKPLPAYPQTIALVTSPTGAAVRDMLRILKARYPIAKVLVVPVLVQGPDAPEEIAQAIALLNTTLACDLIITGRGGGSLEDLWAFNTEVVARAIADSQIPIISAVGHEPDVTIADFVADLRAATPSNAAELAVPDQQALQSALQEQLLRMTQTMRHRCTTHRERIRAITEKPVMQSPLNYFQEKRVLLDFMENRLGSALQKSLRGGREKFVRLSAMLDAMSPLKVLTRGYSIVTDAQNQVIKDSTAVKPGDSVHLRLREGALDCTVTETYES